MKFFHFLGSVYFAILLLTTTALMVIAGTFLESWSGSHLYAAAFTYHNPLFQLLLWGYFINILFATLRRWPFKGKHVPFILTHIGLLMLLGGVLIKSYFGVQGAFSITEGSGGASIFLPNTYALHVEDREKEEMLPLKSALETGSLSIKLLEWTDHAEERFEGFLKGDWGHIVGLPPFQIDAAPFKTTHYEISAHRGAPPPFSGHAALYFLQDQLVAYNETGERFIHPFDTQAYLIFDRGFGGYGVFAELPEHFPKIELIAPLTRVMKGVEPHRKKEELTPRIRLLLSDATESEVVTLTYDKYGTGFKWPALGGRYLLRFQALKMGIPYHVRLREARQINYPETETPYSYEADLLVDGEEATLSMNHVYEKGGYRFYLSNLVAPPGGAKRIQLVVNYDPAKYLLTYPGAIVLALGMLLLYLRRRYA